MWLSLRRIKSWSNATIKRTPLLLLIGILFFFDAFAFRQEFPPYFLPRHYWNTPFNQIPSEVLERSRAKLSNALVSVLNRIQLPLLDSKTGEVRLQFYFEAIKEQLGSDLWSRVDVLPSGGVVRAGKSYLYAEVYNQMLRNPKANPETILEEIARSKEPIASLDVRGIGSDFDLLLRAESAEDFKKTEKILLDLTNSAETHFGAADVRSKSKRNFFTIGDVKDYDEQIKRSTSQGGAEVDFASMALAALCHAQMKRDSSEEEISGDS